MSTSLHSIPIEVRSEIFGYCLKRDLANFVVSSKFWCDEVIPIMWRKVSVRWECLAESNINCKTSNLKHTRNLLLHGGKLSLDDYYSAFNFSLILRNSDPAQLTSLCVENFNIRGGLRFASEMLPLLQSFKVTGVHNSNCFDSMSRFQYLKILSLSRCDITDEQLTQICHLHELNDLELDGCPCLTKKSVQCISLATKLKQLKFSGTKKIFNSDQISKMVTQLPNLARLELCNSNVDDTFFELTGRNLNGLEILDIGWTKISDCGLAAVSRLHKLRKLKIIQCKGISADGWYVLHRLHNLKCLIMYESSISEKGLVHVSKLLSLTDLDVMWCDNVTDVGLHLISNLENLQRLDIGINDAITDDGFSSLKNLRHLQYLSMRALKITNKSLEVISKLSFLEELDISYCTELTDDGLYHLSNLERLRKLEYEDDGCGRLTEEGFEKAGLTLNVL